MLAFLSDIEYWIQNNHPIISALKTYLNFFDEYLPQSCSETYHFKTFTPE